MGKAQKIDSIIKRNNTISISQSTEYRKIKTKNSLISQLQGFLKKRGKIYYFLLKLFSPVISTVSYHQTIKRLLAFYSEEHIILNIGSGPTYFNNREDIINVDIYKYDEVDITGDIMALPIEDKKIDFIINTAILEHVDKANAAVAEMFRILKPGGRIFSYVPFIVPFHGAPQDYYRWTILGIEKLFAKFEITEMGIGAGPTSGMLWIFQEWLAILLSFGSKILHDIVLMVLMILTMPIKFMDLILVKFPNAEKIASGFYIVAERKNE